MVMPLHGASAGCAAGAAGGGAARICAATAIPGRMRITCVPPVERAPYGACRKLRSDVAPGRGAAILSGMSNARAARAYLEDPEQLDFRARIVERSTLPDGSVAVVLDRTCFYPTSGGQPHDTGTLNGVAVFDVHEDDAGRVVHLTRADPGTGDVHGVVDGSRRRDHMQQHSGQHLLSATFVELLGRETVSFHLGAERCSIDLPGEPIAPEELDRVERRANT